MKRVILVLALSLLLIICVGCGGVKEDDLGSLDALISEDKSEIVIEKAESELLTIKVADFGEEFLDARFVSDSVLDIAVLDEDNEKYLLYDILLNEAIYISSAGYSRAASGRCVVYIPADEDYDLLGYDFYSGEAAVIDFVDDFGVGENDVVMLYDNSKISYLNEMGDIIVYDLSKGAHFISSTPLGVNLNAFPGFSFADNAEFKILGDFEEGYNGLLVSAFGEVIIEKELFSEYEFTADADYTGDSFIEIAGDRNSVAVYENGDFSYTIYKDELYNGELNNDFYDNNSDFAIVDSYFFTEDIAVIYIAPRDSAEYYKKEYTHGISKSYFYNIDSKEIVEEISGGYVLRELGGGRKFYYGIASGESVENEGTIFVYANDDEVFVQRFSEDEIPNEIYLSFSLDNRYFACYQSQDAAVDIYRVENELVLLQSVDLIEHTGGAQGDGFGSFSGIGFNEDDDVVLEFYLRLDMIF